MSSSYFYLMCRFINVNGEFKKSVEVAVNVEGGETQWSDWAAADGPTAAEGDPVVCYTTFPNSDSYAVMLDATCPILPPSSSDMFVFCHHVWQAQTHVSSFELPCGGAVMADVEDYLAYWFPSMLTAFQNLDLSPSIKRRELADALSHLIKPTVGNIPLV